MDWIRKAFKIEYHERRAVFWAFSYFFSLLCSYYILRPVRDEMGILGGVENLQWVFTATFVVMLIAIPIFGGAVKRFTRHVLLPGVYYFFALNLFIFFYFFHYEIAIETTARIFFVWLSVFNLFVVSVFWSFMADLFNHEQAKRLFACIAVGGSAGAILGPLITALLAKPLGTTNLLIISIVFIFAATFCIKRLIRWTITEQKQNYHEDKYVTKVPSVTHGNDKALGGSIFAGVKLLMQSRYLLGITLYIWLFTTLSTFLYFEQAHIFKQSIEDSATRTTLFATVDLSINTLTVLLQLFITSRLIQRYGMSLTLALIPAFLVIGFIMLALTPVLPIIITIQIIRRAGNYAISKPAREMLFTVVSREEKYKAKNVIDTVIYRAGDAASAWLFTALMAYGLGLSAIALIAVPLALLWLWTGLWLGKKQSTYYTGPVEKTSILK
ncbi:NTP/NDP exchange transporter [Kaarinaea lacus]